MKADATQLEETVVVGFGSQKKKTVVGAMTSIKVDDLKVPGSNFTTALAGRVAGLVSYQTSGEPGADNANFFIRGVTTFGLEASPLILIDGVELTTEDLSRLNTDDIESFSIMKDATSTAIYGARGANGVIYVTTKSGELGKAKLSIRYEQNVSMPTQKIDLADPLTYLKAHIEASRTRDPEAPLPYSQDKIDNTIAGLNPMVYPSTDWQDLLMEDYSKNHKFNFNIRGGGKVARYYVAGSYTRDNGNLNVDSRNNYNNNIELNRFLLRSNVDITLTPTTEAIIRMHTTLDDYTGPLANGTQTYNMIMRANPVRFPAYYEPTEDTEYVKHIMYGNDDGANYINPYAELTRGYKDYSKSLNMIQLELKQDLDFVAEGLKWRFLGNINRTSHFSLNRSIEPYYYKIGSYNRVDNEYSLEPLNKERGEEFLGFVANDKGRDIKTYMYLESALNYNVELADKHTLSALLVGTVREELDGKAANLQLSLPHRNLGLSGRFTYGYDDRIFTELNFGYNGSERFSKNNKYGFFPSFGLGYLTSNEDWFKSSFISHLKTRFSYGLVGNDAIGRKEDRFFYLSEVDLNSSSRGARFGERGGYHRDGIKINRYANEDITWEVATKSNLGLEVNFFDDAIQFKGDIFHEKRTKILQNRSYIPEAMGLQTSVKANVGEASSQGIDFSIDANKFWPSGFWLTGRINYTYATSKYEVVEEPDYSAYGASQLSRVGQSLKVHHGYIAERLFIDENEVLNSPKQFGEYMAGDIKYKDINNDGVITSLDKVPIGHPDVPEISYGFGFSMGYKKWDVSAFFQGQARVSFFIDPKRTAPFIDSDDGNRGDYLPELKAENALLQAYADDHWSEDNPNVYALYPRLSDKPIENNMQQSTWWMCDGSFLRLKQLEIGFEPLQGGNKTWAGMQSLRVYVSGTNLMQWSGFDLWDPEMKGNGLGYPLQKKFNLGVKIDF